MRAFTRILSAFQNVPPVPEKAGLARFVAGCGKGELVRNPNPAAAGVAKCSRGSRAAPAELRPTLLADAVCGCSEQTSTRGAARLPRLHLATPAAAGFGFLTNSPLP